MANYPLVVNDGLFAGSRTALLALDDAVSRMRDPAGWVGERHDIPYRNRYGTTDGKTAHVRDPSVLPLLALLHYIVRANGCIRVLETGTAKGVSAACLASAVAFRQGGRVVTRRAAEKGREGPDVPNVVFLHLLLDPARRRVDHALAQRTGGLVGHRENSCLAWG